MELKIQRLDKELELPRYHYKDDAAFDLHARKACVIKPGQKVLIPTGIKMEIPKGYAGLIWDRSGLASKNSLHTLAGVIDSGFRGEVKIVMINLSDTFFQIERGMRIAQMIISPIKQPKIVEVDKVQDDGDRKECGFGSSGVN